MIRVNRSIQSEHSGEATGIGVTLAAPSMSRVVRPGHETPNPSIEGMPKRLRLLVTPHVKR